MENLSSSEQVDACVPAVRKYLSGIIPSHVVHVFSPVVYTVSMTVVPET
jgi:hypothetical protein